MKQKLTHVDEQGNARMVDVGDKALTERLAIARGRVQMQPETLRLIRDGALKKGDVLTVAQVAGIQAAKRTHDLIPMCHPLLLTHISVDFSFDERASSILIEARARVRDRTGVEMEALTAVTVAALTLYDMAKAIDRGMRIMDVRLVEKQGGKSGDWRQEDTGAREPEGEDNRG
jgi:cyclic pyranopterin monophosphate synthase